MKSRSFLALCLVSLACIIAPSPCRGDAWTLVGSFFNTSWSWFATYRATHADPVSTGTVLSGSAEFYAWLDPSCNTAPFTGQVTNTAGSGTGYAVVVERRFTHSATVSGSMDGTFVGSCFDYAIQSMQSGPSSLERITVGQCSWELTETTNETYRGTVYYYFKNPGVYSDGRMEGDLQGKFYWNGFDASGHPLAKIYVTSIKGTPVPAVFSLDLVYDNPVVRVWEPNTTHSSVTVDYLDTTSAVTYSGCYSADLTHSGTSFHLPQFNIGHYFGSWESTIPPDRGSIFSYTYKHAPGTNEVVPRLIGLTQAGAEDILRLHGFVPGSVTAAASTTFPTGRVIIQGQSAGSLRNLGTSVDLVVANSVAQQIRVPVVTGMTLSDAARAISSAGLSVGTVSQVNDSAPAGQVIGQDPAAGSSVAVGSSVVLTVSLGPVMYALTTSVIGDHGTISPPSGNYAPGTRVTLTAEPDAGYQVMAWHGTDNDSLTTMNNTITMNATHAVTVEFEPASDNPTFALDISVPSGHGTLVADPPTGPYAHGAVVTLTATPDSGYQLKAWTGTDNNTSKNTTNTITMNADRTVTVEFELVSDGEENDDGGGGGGGGCFISTSAAMCPALLTYLFSLLGIGWVGAACLCRLFRRDKHRVRPDRI